MKTFGSCARDPIECSGEHVLTGVLLHVFEAPCPINRAVDGAGLDGSLDHMKDFPIVSVGNVDDARGAQLTGVERLTA